MNFYDVLLAAVFLQPRSTSWPDRMLLLSS